MNSYKLDPMKVRAWRDAAVADGWAIEPTYDGHESVDRAATLEKDGFRASMLTREPIKDNPALNYSMFSVSIWGPDKMDIPVQFPYDWQAIRRAVTHCPVCGKDDVKTVRVAFANRACEACAPTLRKKMETPGWCD